MWLRRFRVAPLQYLSGKQTHARRATGGRWAGHVAVYFEDMRHSEEEKRCGMVRH
jgi:hypothetical protein